MFDELQRIHLGDVATWLSAVATFAAVVVALKIAGRQQRDARLAEDRAEARAKSLRHTQAAALAGEISAELMRSALELNAVIGLGGRGTDPGRDLSASDLEIAHHIRKIPIAALARASANAQVFDLDTAILIGGLFGYLSLMKVDADTLLRGEQKWYEPGHFTKQTLALAVDAAARMSALSIAAWSLTGWHGTSPIPASLEKMLTTVARHLKKMRPRLHRSPCSSMHAKRWCRATRCPASCDRPETRIGSASRDIEGAVRVRHSTCTPALRGVSGSRDNDAHGVGSGAAHLYEPGVSVRLST